MQRRTFLQLSAASAAAVFSDPVSSRASAVEDMLGDNELKRHIIRETRLIEVQLKYPRLVGKNARSDIHGYGPKIDLIEIITDKGAKGWGTLREHQNFKSADEYIKGKKVSDLFSLAEGITDKKAGPFDFALHDLAGIICNKPVYQLISKRSKPVTTMCYSGMIYFDDLEPQKTPGGIDAILKECEWDYKYGYRQFKLKLGRGHKWMPEKEGMQRDIDVTKAIAKSFPDCDILMDPNDRYTVDSTIRYLEGITDIPLFWIEEPFKETVKDYKKLKEWLNANGRQKTLIADGEWAPDLPLALELGKQKLLDVYLEDLSNLGLTKWRKLNPELKKAGITSSPHCWGDMFKSYYSAHLIGAQGNSPTLEGVTCSCEDIDFSNYKMENGKLIPPPLPGFGITLLK